VGRQTLVKAEWKIGPKERDRRVDEIVSLPSGIPSNAVHVKLCVNLSGPPDKAKY
jgi:hypothetical protein